MPTAARRRRWSAMLALVTPAALLIGACATTRGAQEGKKGFTERGLASWYGPGFHGRQAANGETYDMHAMTAAHRTLPFDTVVEVYNRDNGQRARVRINDRGPFVRGRIIDVSHEAATRLGMIGPGTARVEIRVVVEAAEFADSRKYWVQAGAFRTADEAASLYRELREQFPDVHLTADGTWHRIRLGPFNKRKNAERMRHRLQKQGVDAFVTRI